MTPTKILAKLQPSRQKIKPRLSRHCLGTLTVKDSARLFDADACLSEVKKILNNNSADCLGEQTHKFPNKSFTILIALAESHISIHTWPERMVVQLDVFLCNYLHDNTEKCQNIYDDIVEYFGAIEANTTTIERI